MRTISKQDFNSIGESFRKAFKKAERESAFNGNRVLVTIEGIKDDAYSMYPLIEITNEHVTVTSNGESKVITDSNLKASVIVACE